MRALQRAFCQAYLQALAPLDDASAAGATLARRIEVAVDVSGSMSGTPMEAAIGLGVLVSELASPAFRDRVLTFESQPNWVDLSGCASIVDKVSTVQRAGWGGSTNFKAACERILAVAEGAKLSPDEVPDLLVLSDMQFDAANGRGGYYGSYGYGYS